MKSSNSLSKETVQVADVRPDVQEQIRMRAYELYEQGGREDGRELENWLRAESEIVGVQALAQAA
jgi:hypothetical protein